MRLKKTAALVLAAFMILMSLSGCAKTPAADSAPVESASEAETAVPADPAGPEKTTDPDEPNGETMEETKLRLWIDDTEIAVMWEENASVDALSKMAAEQPVTVRMSMYGGFEQVGSLGKRLPSSDSRMTTAPGDIVLYSSSQIVIFYGSNSWAYTRLGKAAGKTASEMADLLGKGDVTVTISCD